MMLPLIASTAGSVPIVWWSRRSLLQPSSHGFYRFFAFEAILGLIVINAPQRFARPVSMQHLVSWFLLVISIVLLIWGVVLLRRLGGSRPPPEGSTEFKWERTERLVTTGLYRHIRHPMYASLLFLAWGALLKSVSSTAVVLAAVATLALIATAKAEERENVARFGHE